MSKNQVKVNLVFGADTSRAKQSLMDLQSQLNQFNQAMASNKNFAISDDIREAQVEMAKLNVALKESVNTSTGKFDLSKFDQSLKKSGTSLNQLKNKFMATGAEGQKAFLSLTNSIMSAEIPLRRSGKLLSDFADTLKKTAKWQLSSSIYRGFTGAIQSAYGYAQDLNKSLNDIRIVTNYDAQYMAKFAKEANKAAKALSATTNEYAKASLIYFQQGLSDKEVAQRTATTIKLANVTGETAENVSSYMTAVWNNFDNGTKSLEYYADAITALGAATASSSEEIATGLQKFSAVANTVGLSYEYATAALATVTSQTRESAETVGTAFKTIFARLESLSLGETLDDDTNMTKYSQALAKVGVNIKDSTGALKNMDTIIDELGSKWNNINQDQQIALAQTVAGMRQYNNFIALMDNYKTFSANVEIASQSTGTLEEQADIYAESWEAARDRVQAAAESVYNTLLNDKFFIKILNFTEKIISGIDTFIDRMGGLKGILPIISTLLLKVFNKQISESIDSAAYSFKVFTGQAAKEAVKYKEEAYQQAQSLATTGTKMTTADKVEAEGQKRILDLQKILIDNDKYLSSSKKEQLEQLIKTIELENKYNQEKAKSLELAQDEANEQKDKLQTMLKTQEAMAKAKVQKLEDEVNTANEEAVSKKKLAEAMPDVSELAEEAQNAKAIADEKKKIADEEKGKADTAVKRSELLKELLQKQKVFNDQLEDGSFAEEIAALTEQYEKGELQTRAYKTKMKAIAQGLVDAGQEDVGATLTNAIEHVNKNDKNHDISLKTIKGLTQKTNMRQISLDQMIEQMTQSNLFSAEEITEFANAQQHALDKAKDLEKGLNNTSTSVNKFGQVIMEEEKTSLSFGETISTAAAAATAFASAGQGLANVLDTITDPEMSSWEKMTTIFTTLAMVIPTMMSGLNSFAIILPQISKGFELLTANKMKDTIINGMNAASEWLLAKAKKGTAKASEQASKAQSQETKEQVVDTAVDGAQKAVDNVPSRKSRKYKVKGGQTIKAPKTASSKSISGGAKGVGSSVKTLGTSMKSFVTSMGPTIGGLALIAAGISIIVGAIAISVKVFNQAKNEAKSASKMAQQFAETAKEAKAEYDNLLTTTSNYEDAKKGLEELTKGTEEYRQKLQQTNQEALALIEGNEELAGKYKMVNGVIEFQDGALEDLEKQKFETSQQIEASSLIMKSVANDAENEAKAIEMARKVSSGEDWGKKLGNAAAATAVGAGSGALIGTGVGVMGGGPYGAAIGAVAGAVTGLTVGAITAHMDLTSTKTEAEILEKLQKKYTEDQTIFSSDTALRKALDELGVEGSLIVDSLVENRKYLEENTKAIHQNTLENESMKSLIIEQQNAGNDRYQGDALKDYYTAFQKKALETDSKEYKETYDELFAKNSGYDFGNENFRKEYLQTMYGAEADQYDIKNWAGEGFTLMKKNEDGQWEKVGEKDAQSKTSAVEAFIKKKTSEITDVEMDKWGKQAAEIENQLTHAIGDASVEQVRAIGVAFADEAASINLDAYSLKELQNIDLNKISNAELKAQMEEAIQEAEKSWEHIYDNYFTGNQKILTALKNDSNEFLANLDKNQVKAYGETLDAIAGVGGQEAANAFGATFNDLIRENSDKAEQIWQIFSTLDWENPEETLSKMKGSLHDIGIELDSAKWNKLEEFNFSNALLDNLDTVRSQLAAIKKIVDDLSLGSIVSDEDYKTLTDYNGELKKSFVYTTEGYKYIGEENTGAELYSEMAMAKYNKLMANIQKKETMAKKASGMRYSSGKEISFTDLAGAADTTNAQNVAEYLLKNWTDEDFQGFGSSKTELQEALLAIQNDPSNTDAQADLRAIMGKIASVQTAYETKALEDEGRNAQELLASSVNTVSELQDLLSEELISSEVYDNFAKIIQDTNKKLREQIDIYHELNRAQEANAKLQEKINIIKERSYGNKHLEYIQAETAALEQQLTLDQQRLATARADEISSKQNLINEFSKLGLTGIDLQFDQNTGELLNLQQIENAMISQGKRGQIEGLKQVITNYEDAIDTVNDYETQVLTTQDNIDEKFLEYMNYTLEINVEVNDRALDHLKRQLEELQDDSFTTAESLSNLLKQGKIEAKNYENYKTAILGLASENNVNIEGKDLSTVMNEALNSGNLSSEERSQMLSWYDEMLKSYDNMKDIQQSWDNTILKHFTDLQQVYTDFVDQANEINQVISDFENIADITGAGLLGFDVNEFKKNMAKASEGVALQSIAVAQDTLKRLEEDRAVLINKLSGSNISDEERKEYEDELKEIDKLITQTGNNVRQHWADALQAATDAFSASVEQAAADFEEAMAGVYGTIDRMQQVFDQKTNISQQYLADYKKIYELSKLTRQIENKIDNASSVKAKRSLAELQKEINALEANGVEMSQYDLEYLQKRYELKLAEIALEDQQNAKSQVRLTKMADGSWGYLYTKNMDDVESAVQQYEDALYAAQETSDNYLNDLASSIVKIQSEASEAITAVWNDASLTMEERQKQADELAAYYTEQMRYYTSEYDKAVGNNYSLYTIDWMNFSSFTGNKIKSAEDFNDTFDKTILGSMNTYAASAEAVYNNFNTNLGSAPGEGGEGSGLLGALYSASSSYKSEVDSIFSTAGTTLAGYASNVYDTMGIGADGAESGEGGLIPSLRQAFDYANETLKNQKLLDAIGTTWDNWYGTAGSGGFADKVNQAKTDINSLVTMFSTAPDMSNPTYLITISDAIENWRTGTLAGILGKVKTDISSALAASETETKAYEARSLIQNATDLWMDKSIDEGDNEALAQLLHDFVTQSGLTKEHWASLGIDESTIDTISRYTGDSTTGPTAKRIVNLGNSLGTIISNIQGGSYATFSSSASDDESDTPKTPAETAPSEEPRLSLSTIQGPGVIENSASTPKEYTQMTDMSNVLANYFQSSEYGFIDSFDIKEQQEYYDNLDRPGLKFGVRDSTDDNSSSFDFRLPNTKLAFSRLKEEYIDFDVYPDETNEFLTTYLNKLSVVDKDRAYIVKAPNVFYENGDLKYTPSAHYWVYYNGKVERLRTVMGNEPISAFDESSLKGFNTGGYTGAWGSEGRLAMLHQKEIVLNADDTENMLAAVDILRQVVQQIDLQAAAASHSLFANAPSISSTGDTLQQEVTIHAEFPNATNHSEIEEAFDTLINRAAQYTNRKRY